MNMNNAGAGAFLSGFDKNIASHCSHIHPMIPRDSEFAKKYLSIEKKYQNASDEDFVKITDKELELLLDGEDPQDKWRSSWSRKIGKLYKERKESGASFKDNDTQNDKNDIKSRSTTDEHIHVLQHSRRETAFIG